MTGRSDTLRAAGAVLISVVGVVHLQQYLSFIKDVPTIGVLFLLNALGAGGVCVLLATRARLLAALGGIGLSIGALISILISHYASGGLFAYRESTFRAPAVIAMAAELASVGLLGAYIARRARPAAAEPV